MGQHKGASLYQNELPVVSQKLDQAADFVKNDYPSIRKDLTDTLGTVNQKMPELESALNQTNDLIANDWPKSIKAGVQKAADAIRKGKEVDLGNIVKLLKLDATKSDFLTLGCRYRKCDLSYCKQWVQQVHHFIQPLCLWVGAFSFLV